MQRESQRDSDDLAAALAETYRRLMPVAEDDDQTIPILGPFSAGKSRWLSEFFLRGRVEQSLLPMSSPGHETTLPLTVNHGRQASLRMRRTTAVGVEWHTIKAFPDRKQMAKEGLGRRDCRLLLDAPVPELLYTDTGQATPRRIALVDTPGWGVEGEDSGDYLQWVEQYFERGVLAVVYVMRVDAGGSASPYGHECYEQLEKLVGRLRKQRVETREAIPLLIYITGRPDSDRATLERDVRNMLATRSITASLVSAVDLADLEADEASRQKHRSAFVARIYETMNDEKKTRASWTANLSALIAERCDGEDRGLWRNVDALATALEKVERILERAMHATDDGIQGVNETSLRWAQRRADFARGMWLKQVLGPASEYDTWDKASEDFCGPGLRRHHDDPLAPWWNETVAAPFERLANDVAHFGGDVGVLLDALDCPDQARRDVADWFRLASVRPRRDALRAKAASLRQIVPDLVHQDARSKALSARLFATITALQILTGTSATPHA